MLSSDLTILGNVRTSGDIQVEGIVEGDIRAQMLIVGESATVKGEVIAEEVVVHGRVVGRLRGLKVRLCASRPRARATSCTRRSPSRAARISRARCSARTTRSARARSRHVRSPAPAMTAAE